MEGPDALIPIAMAVLASLFFGAFVVLVLICRRSRSDGDYLTKQQMDMRCEAELLPGMGAGQMAAPELELGEVCALPDLEHMLALRSVTEGAEGEEGKLVAHGLAVLRACHTATQHLAAAAMGPSCSRRAGRHMMEAARRMGARVDDVVRALHPPVDARLLEARAQALALAVAHLSAISTLPPNATPHVALQDMDKHLMVLREAALAQEASCCIQNVIATSTPM